MMCLVTLGSSGPGAPGGAPERARGPVRAATRARSGAWRDPRLWVGILVVAVSVVAGARLLAAADDTVEVWAVGTDAGPGARLDPTDLRVERVRFADAGELASYFTTADRLPADLRLVRGVAAGELLPRAALGGTDEPADTVELPVAVDADQVPPAVAAGSVVDVYLGGGGRAGDRGAGPVLDDATVVAAPPLESTFGATTGRRQLVLAVSSDDASRFLDRLGRSRQPLLTVVRQG
jgi:hypothetical protein